MSVERLLTLKSTALLSYEEEKTQLKNNVKKNAQIMLSKSVKGRV